MGKVPVYRRRCGCSTSSKHVHAMNTPLFPNCYSENRFDKGMHFDPKKEIGGTRYKPNYRDDPYFEQTHSNINIFFFLLKLSILQLTTICILHGNVS